MKTSTLIGIAREIERERKVHIRATMNEMWEMLESAAGHCRTKAEAKKAILDEVYDIREEAYTVRNVYGIAGESTHRTPEAACKAAAKREGEGWIVEDQDGNRWTMSGPEAVKI